MDDASRSWVMGLLASYLDDESEDNRQYQNILSG